ncbi:MAG: hypothetical protein ACYTFY_08835 [Planctomycetota bacterium]|jgi:hypothetical protein
MQTIFNSTFQSSELENWQIEQHVPDGYTDFAVKDNCLVMHDAGSRIIPNIPDLENFSIKGSFDLDWEFCNNIFSLQFYLGYDVKKRQGVVFDISSDGENYSCSINGDFEQSFPAPQTEVIDFLLRVEDSSLNVSINNGEVFNCKLEEKVRGVIALSRGSFFGELRISSFEISTSDNLKVEKVWDNIEIPFAPINGMDIPIVWTVNAESIGNDVTKLDVELSGGEKSRPDIEWFPYHAHYVEFLNTPYLRIEQEGRGCKLILCDDTMVLANPAKEWFYTFKKEYEWPYKRTFYLQDIESDAVLAAGYESYANRPANRHQEVDSAFETILCTEKREIIYSGPAMQEGALNLELRSSDKKICGDIPETIHYYEKALQHAEKNHYFSDGEECAFFFTLDSKVDLEKTNVEIFYRLENAFFEAVGDYVAVSLVDSSEGISEKINLGKLPSGIYHIRFKLLFNNREILRNYRAFEVNGSEQSGIAASRLPVCFSMHNEIKGCDTDYFDPWKDDIVDVSHYISICNTIMPHFAREKKLWELLKLYKRKWFLWHAWRVMENTNLSDNKDLVENCDYIFTRSFKQVFRPAARQYFNKFVLQYLHEYAVENDFHAEEIKRCLDEKKVLPLDIFSELVENHFYAFNDYLLDQYMEKQKSLKREVNSINPQAKMSSYGPVSIYMSCYKTANSVSYCGPYRLGPALGEIKDGFLIFEDYPHTCRYSMSRGTFLLADIKLKNPGLTIYPEMYVNHRAEVPCPDAAVARVFPSYGIRPGEMEQSKGSILKRVLEFVYATGCHDGKSFRYWQDHGFQTRTWSRAQFADLLELWGFIDKHLPGRPLKANAFVSSIECCRNNKLFYDEYPGDRYEGYGDLINTAEECIAYTYEMSRNAGQNAGYVSDFGALDNLTEDDIDILIIPPLTSVEEAQLSTIRHLHERGVSLLAFENVTGLEDLFGVEKTDPVQVNNISVNTELADNPLLSLAELQEYTEHRACTGNYSGGGADILLAGEAPVLFVNKTKWGRTALFNIPPTTVRRMDQYNRVNIGRDSISKLINKSTELILRYLSKPQVETDQGKVTAFKDINNKTHIILAEDTHPLPAKAIDPTLTINLLDISEEDIICDKEFSVISSQLKMHLEPDEIVFISIK